jgi:hypothetical protein
MSSKRKSPPTKLDGNNGITDPKLSEEADAEIDLSIRNSEESNNFEINHQLNGDRKAKRRGGDIQVSFPFEFSVNF